MKFEFSNLEISFYNKIAKCKRGISDVISDDDNVNNNKRPYFTEKLNLVFFI